MVTDNVLQDTYDFSNQLPEIKVEWVEIKNYKVYDYAFLDFRDENGDCKNFVSFIGPNGCGKSTVLAVLQLLFFNFSGYTKERLKANLEKAVRHVSANCSCEDDFCIRAGISSSLGQYEVSLNKNGFIEPHPAEVSKYAYRLCYMARFDQELHKFQLLRSQWKKFKDMFESVTGYEIEEQEALFSSSFENNKDEVSKDYVFSFNVKKTHETISYRECSDGEKKVIKSLSSLLNCEIFPEVILVDNIEMHVESGRHLPLIQAMRRSFPESQIFTTTHSYHISRNFSQRSQIYDLRMIRCNNFLRQESWRLYMIDEIDDSITRLISLQTENSNQLIQQGYVLKDRCMEEEQSEQFRRELAEFMSSAAKLFVNNLIN